MKRASLYIVLTGCLLIPAYLLLSQTTQPAKAFLATMARGKQVYHDQCLPCHQADGGGTPDMNPPLIKTTWVLGKKTPLVQVVLTGMKGVEINGDPWHNVMAPHHDLTDQQIADVLTYVRNSFGNKASAVSAAEVKAIRAKTKLN